MSEPIRLGARTPCGRKHLLPFATLKSWSRRSTRTGEYVQVILASVFGSNADAGGKTRLVFGRETTGFDATEGLGLRYLQGQEALGVCYTNVTRSTITNPRFFQFGSSLRRRLFGDRSKPAFERLRKGYAKDLTSLSYAPV